MKFLESSCFGSSKYPLTTARKTRGRSGFGEKVRIKGQASKICESTHLQGNGAMQIVLGGIKILELCAIPELPRKKGK